MKKVAINGLGRIGRAFFRLAYGNPDIDIVAVNDPFITPQMARYLLLHDSVYGPYKRTIVATDGALEVDGKRIPLLTEKEPDKLPWGEMGIDLVIESTGVFRAYDGPKGATRHLQAGAKKVLQTVPSKGDGAEKIPQIVFGVNESEAEGCDIVSAASCTTNSLVPVMYVLEKEFGIEQASLSTIHGYTADQRLVDSAHGDFGRARAAAINIIPTTTGAASATAKVIPSLKGKMDGMAFRVPVPTGSVSDVTIVTRDAVTTDAANEALKKHAAGDLKGILGVSEDPMVSSDVVADPRPSVVDPSLTKVLGEHMLKVVAFYDNEWGYTNQLLRLARAL